MALGTALPYGLRDVKIVKYPTLAADVFGSTLVDLPNAQTFSFTDTEEYTDLRGDDKLVTSHGQGSEIEWELESGGISIPAYLAINGGQVIETGITPNQKQRYRKKVTDQRPFFSVIGQSISDSGGDFHAIVYLARSTGELSGELKDGEFMIPGASGKGFPCRVAGMVGGAEIQDALYDFVQNETIAAITAPGFDTPTAPTVTSLSDTSGPIAGGELVIASGYGFTGVTGVTVGGTPATDYEVLSVNQVALTTPAHAAGATNVVISNAAGASTTGAGNGYSYV